MWLVLTAWIRNASMLQRRRAHAEPRRIRRMIASLAYEPSLASSLMLRWRPRFSCRCWLSTSLPWSMKLVEVAGFLHRILLTLELKVWVSPPVVLKSLSLSVKWLKGRSTVALLMGVVVEGASPRRPPPCWLIRLHRLK